MMQIIDIEKIEMDIFRGKRKKVGWKRVFGGKVIGKEMIEEKRKVDKERNVNQIKEYLVSKGDNEIKIIYEVDRIREG